MDFPNTTWGMTVASGVDQVDAIVVLGVSPTIRIGPHIAVPHHVGDLEVGGDLVHAVLSRHSRVTLRYIVLAFERG